MIRTSAFCKALAPFLAIIVLVVLTGCGGTAASVSTSSSVATTSSSSTPASGSTPSSGGTTSSNSTSGNSTPKQPNVGGGDNSPSSGAAKITVTVAPANATLIAGQSQTFAATVTGTTASGVTWLVNGVAGGNATTGTITSSGGYTAPTPVPSSAVSISAVSAADPSKSAQANVSFTPVAITVSPTSATLSAGQTQTLSANVSGTSNSAVTWLVNGVTGGNSTMGTISTTGLFAAPATVPASPASITAVSSADPSKSASATITFAAPAIAVTVSPSSVTLGSGQAQAFSANVSGTTNSGVTWLVNGVPGGNATLGTITSSGLYTAPTTVPGSTVSVSAVSTVDTSKSGTAAISFGPGTNYYVAPAGSDSNDGSQAHPWATIQHAANQVAAGATVHVAPGTYSGAITTNTSGTSSSRIKFVSDVQWGALIRATAVDIVWTNMGDYVDIEGFDIAGNDPTTCNGIINYASYGRIVGNNVHNVGLDNTACVFGSGIVNHQNDAGHDDDIIGNVVHDIGDLSIVYQYHHGIYHANLRGHVWNNLVYRCEGWGIHMWHAANQVTVANNTVFNNNYGGILVGDGDDPGGFPAGVVNDYTVVSNNIVYQNGLNPAASGYGIEEYGNTGPNNQYLNNLVYQNGPANWNLQNGIVPVASITAVPQFVNYQADGSGNYQLQPGSPDIATGTGTGAPTTDILGASRPSSSPDIGAYQSNSVPGTWPYVK